MILLYADDPGAANYLAPVYDLLAAKHFESKLLFAEQLRNFALERGMGSSFRDPNESTGAVLHEVRILVVGTSEDAQCFGNALIDEARQAGIPSVGVVDMTVNADRRFRGLTADPLHHAPNWLAVPNDACRKVFVQLGFPLERIVVCGHPIYDRTRQRRDELRTVSPAVCRKQHFLSAPSERPVWLFLAEGVDRLNPLASFKTDDYTLHGRGDSAFRATIVLEEIVDCASRLVPRPWIALRPHPKSDLGDFDPIRPELDQIMVGGDPLPQLWAADLVLGMTTMLLLEAYLLGVTHLSVLPRISEKDWLDTLSLGVTPVVATRSELWRALSNLQSSSPGNGRIDGELSLPKDCTGKVMNLILNNLSTRS